MMGGALGVSKFGSFPDGMEGGGSSAKRVSVSCGYRVLGGTLLCTKYSCSDQLHARGFGASSGLLYVGTHDARNGSSFALAGPNEAIVSCLFLTGSPTEVTERTLLSGIRTVTNLLCLPLLLISNSHLFLFRFSFPSSSFLPSFLLYFFSFLLFSHFYSIPPRLDCKPACEDLIVFGQLPGTE